LWRRDKIRETDQDRSRKASYLAVYELEADDLGQPLAEPSTRSADGRMDMDIGPTRSSGLLRPS